MAIAMTGMSTIDDIEFGSTSLIPQSYLIKMDHEGTVQWVRQFVESSYVTAHSMALGRNNDLYIAGDYFFQFSVNGNDYVPISGADGFVMRIDTAGMVQWVQPFTGNNNVRAYSVAVNEQGDCFVGGVFSDEVVIGDSTHTLDWPEPNKPTSSELFITRLDMNGDILMSKQFGSPGNNQIAGISITPAGTIVVGGSGANTVSLGEVIIPGPDGYGSGFVAEFSQDGEALGGVRLLPKGDGSNTLESMAVDFEGKITVVGRFESEIGLPEETLTGTDSLSGYVVQFAPDLSLVRWKEIAGTGNSTNLVRADRMGEIYITGFFQGVLDASETTRIEEKGNGGDYYLMKLADFTLSAPENRNGYSGDNRNCSAQITYTSGGNAHITLSRPGTATISLYDIIGNHVATVARNGTVSSDNTITIPLDAYPSGHYMLVVETNTCMQAKPLEIVR